MTLFYGSSCANNGKDAFNTPEERACSRSGSQSRQRSAHIPGVGANRIRGASVVPEREPIASSVRIRNRKRTTNEQTKKPA
eukprot:429427-Prorocentrum_minimum.AAC.1